jgi:hypothetical protein
MSAASIPHSPAASTARLVENTDISMPSQPGRRAPGPIPTQNPKCAGDKNSSTPTPRAAPGLPQTAAKITVNSQHPPRGSPRSAKLHLLRDMPSCTVDHFPMGHKLIYYLSIGARQRTGRSWRLVGIYYWGRCAEKVARALIRFVGF